MFIRPGRHLGAVTDFELDRAAERYRLLNSDMPEFQTSRGIRRLFHVYVRGPAVATTNAFGTSAATDAHYANQYSPTSFTQRINADSGLTAGWRRAYLQTLWTAATADVPWHPDQAGLGHEPVSVRSLLSPSRLARVISEEAVAYVKGFGEFARSLVEPPRPSAPPITQDQIIERELEIDAQFHRPDRALHLVEIFLGRYTGGPKVAVEAIWRSISDGPSRAHYATGFVQALSDMRSTGTSTPVIDTFLDEFASSRAPESALFARELAGIEKLSGRDAIRSISAAPHGGWTMDELRSDLSLAFGTLLTFSGEAREALAEIAASSAFVTADARRNPVIDAVRAYAPATRLQQPLAEVLATVEVAATSPHAALDSPGFYI